MKSIARLSMLAVTLLPSVVFAEENAWTNSGTSSWFLDSNWSLASVPTDANLATIDIGTAQVDAVGAVASGTIVLGAGKLSVQDGGTLSLGDGLYVVQGGTATVTGAGSSLTSAYVGVGADGGGVGGLTISSGATLTTTGLNPITAQIGGHYIAHYAAGTGTVTVTGTGSQWNIDNFLLIGNDPGEDGNIGNGTLNVLAGGKVDVGVHPLNDPENTGITVGNGAVAGTTGQITVSGAGSELDAYAINLGQKLATGTLTVDDGGLVKSEEIGLGSSFGGIGNIHLNGTGGNSGVLETSSINPHHGSLEFNGGTLRATADVFADWGEDATTSFVVNGLGIIDTNGHDLGLSMPVSGSGEIRKQGAGELVIAFAAGSTFTNGAFVNEAGKMTFATEDFDTSTSELIVHGGEVALNEDHTFAGLSGDDDTSIDIDDHTLTVNVPAMTGNTYGGDIHGDGSFVKGGAGTLMLTGENTWNGTTTVWDGVLRAGSTAALPQGGVTYDVKGGVLDLNDNDLTVETLTGTGGEIRLGTGGNAKLTLNQENDRTLASAITGAGRLIKNGEGKLTLTGASVITTAGEFTETVVVHKGAIVVSGADASLAVADSGIFVGHEATDDGTLEIRDGASVTSKRVYLGTGPDATGHVVVTGAGSEWTGSTGFAVGYGGSGTLEISDGGKVTTSEAIIGHQGNGTGTALVTGSGSMFNSDILYVGNEKTGHLTIANGAAVTVSVNPDVPNSGTVIIGNGPGVVATLDIGTDDLLSTAGTLTAPKIEFRSTDGHLRFNQTNATTLSSNISGSGRVTQAGSGTTTLTGTSTYSGHTYVDGGTLLVNGSITSDVSVASGATLGGSGSVGGIALDLGSALSPGGDFSVGTFNAISLTWNAGAAIDFDLGATTSDLLNLSGAFTKSDTGTFQFMFRDAGWQEGHTYTLIGFGSTDFDDSSFSFGNAGGFDGTFAFNGSTLEFTLVAIPEPSTYGLALIGLLVGLTILRVRSKGTSVAA